MPTACPFFSRQGRVSRHAVRTRIPRLRFARRGAESLVDVSFARAQESYQRFVTKSIVSAIILVVFSGIVIVFGAGAVPLAIGVMARMASEFPMSKNIVFIERART
jgi:hypothetical protein